MAALPPTAGGPSDPLPDTHSPSSSVKPAATLAAAAKSGAVAAAGVGGADGPPELSKALQALRGWMTT